MVCSGTALGRVGGDRGPKGRVPSPRHVNAVEPGAPQRDVFYAEFPKRFEAQAIGTVVDENADRLSAAGHVCDLSGEAVFHETPHDVVPRGGSLERFTVGGFSVEDDSLDQVFFYCFEGGEEAGNSDARCRNTFLPLSCLDFLHAFAVVADRTVRGELAHARAVKDRLARSCLRSKPQRAHSLLRVDVALIAGKQHKGIVIEEIFDKRAEQLDAPSASATLDMKLMTSQGGILPHALQRIIAGKAEDFSWNG